MRLAPLSALALCLVLAPAAEAAPRVVRGQALRPDGKPAAGARVWLGWGGRLFNRGFVEGKADARGRFQLKVDAEDIRFLAVGAALPGSAPGPPRRNMGAEPSDGRTPPRTARRTSPLGISPPTRKRPSAPERVESVLRYD